LGCNFDASVKTGIVEVSIVEVVRLAVVDEVAEE
jgi:hypothetical protein